MRHDTALIYLRAIEFLIYLEFLIDIMTGDALPFT